MPIDMIATITPQAGKEDQVEQIIIDLAAKVDKQETGALRYLPTKVVGGEGPVEFIVIERYVARRARRLHSNTVLPT